MYSQWALKEDKSSFRNGGAIALTGGASFWFSNERKVAAINKKTQKVPKGKQVVAKWPPGCWKTNSPEIQMQQEWLNMDTEPKLQAKWSLEVF